MPLKISTEAEFNELFSLYYEELCRVVIPIVHNPDVAEDVVQDVFVKLWINREALVVNTSFKAYLYKASVYRALDHLRKQKNTDIAHTELKHSSQHSDNATDSQVYMKELTNAINEGMDKMTENMKTIFQLSRFSGLKNREIAEELDISIKTVESNMGKALKIMHTSLSSYIKNGLILLFFWLSEIM
jgi:RNA polymerase sigma-70 factor (ECF subfamily)